MFLNIKLLAKVLSTLSIFARSLFANHLYAKHPSYCTWLVEVGIGRLSQKKYFSKSYSKTKEMQVKEVLAAP